MSNEAIKAIIQPTKPLKCNKCDKTLQVPLDYEFKSCPICRTKYLEAYRAKIDLKKQMIQQSKELQIHDVNELPEHLRSWKAYEESVKRQNLPKPLVKDYMKAKHTWKMMQIAEEAQFKEKVAQEPHWAVPVNPDDKCGEVRTRRMAGQKPLEDTLHIDGCKVCREWYAVWSRGGKGFDFFKAVKQAIPHESSGLQDRPDLTKIVQEDLKQYGQEPKSDVEQEHMREEKEAFEEANRINELSEIKKKKFLERKDDK